MAFLVKGSILPIGGVVLGRVCACSLRSRLVFVVGNMIHIKKSNNKLIIYLV